MVARTLDDADWEEDVLPIIYLPGVYRSQFRDVESAPDLLKPLMELQYRGNFWIQKNHKDWTVVAFLKSKDGGLGLGDVTEDDRTREDQNILFPSSQILRWIIGRVRDWRRRISMNLVSLNH